MKAVSNTYDAYSDVRRVDISISFNLVDLDANGNATASATLGEEQSALSDLLVEDNHATGKWLTLEPDLWKLDGSWSPLPDDQTFAFWSSVLSDADGVFATGPTVTLTLSASASSVGFTLRFDDLAQCWPSEFAVNAYTGDTLLASQTVENQVALCTVDMPVEGYDKVVFTFLKTNEPYRRIRLYEVLFGIVQQFDKDTIVTATFEEGASLLCDSIPSRELEFTFDNSDYAYNLVNPDGIYKYLQDGQEIKSALRINGESVDMGTYYFTKAEATDGTLTATITANDKVYAWDSDICGTGEEGTWTLEEAVATVLGEDVAVRISEEAKERIVYKCIPTDTSKREALRLLAQAGRCSCWIDRTGTVVLQAMDLGTSVDVLDSDNMESMDGVSVSELVDCIKLTVTNDFAETEETYTSGDGSNVESYANCCAKEGQAVADWLLAVAQRRLAFECSNRGNPAVEIGDTITVYNAYDQSQLAAVEELELVYDGGLEATTKALGGTWD